MKRAIWFLGIFLVACNPSAPTEDDFQTAVAQTVATSTTESTQPTREPATTSDFFFRLQNVLVGEAARLRVANIVTHPREPKEGWQYATFDLIIGSVHETVLGHLSTHQLIGHFSSV